MDEIRLYSFDILPSQRRMVIRRTLGTSINGKSIFSRAGHKRVTKINDHICGKALWLLYSSLCII